MFIDSTEIRRRLAVLIACSWCAAAALPVRADEASPAPATFLRSQNVTINLIHRMVERGLLTRKDADELIAQAEADAVAAREEAATSGSETSATKVVTTPAPAPEGTVRVTYVPEVVKEQLRAEIEDEVLAQARSEKWMAPKAAPEWVDRFRVFGDLRTRWESNFFPENQTGYSSDYWNFAAINTAATPYDYTAAAQAPSPNFDQTRNRVRLRARLGANIDLDDGFTAGLRVATGESNSPVSPNQSLGASGGNFSKYAIWLDRAFIRYQPDEDFSIYVGRFDNPFFASTTIFDDDLGFDGLAVTGGFEVAQPVKAFYTIGAFPVFNTDFNFASNQPEKFKSEDKYLFAAQLGADWKIADKISARIGAALYWFDNVEGHVSTPFIPTLATDVGDTDASRPSFAQRGNTYIALRDILGDATNDNGNINQWQYFGLATPFHEFAFDARVDYDRYEPVRVSLQGEFVQNLAFSRGDILVNGPAALTGPVNNNSDNGDFEGGDTAWTIDLRVGRAVLAQKWDWAVTGGYRYVESDAVVDGLAESDFGGGGTNLKGFYLGGNLALTPRVWFSLRWLSATAIAGPTYKNDILQFDFNGKF